MKNYYIEKPNFLFSPQLIGSEFLRSFYPQSPHSIVSFMAPLERPDTLKNIPPDTLFLHFIYEKQHLSDYELLLSHHIFLRSCLSFFPNVIITDEQLYMNQRPFSESLFIPQAISSFFYCQFLVQSSEDIGYFPLEKTDISPAQFASDVMNSFSGTLLTLEKPDVLERFQ